MDLGAARNISLVILSLEAVILLVVLSAAALFATIGIRRVRKGVSESLGKLAGRAKEIQGQVATFSEDPFALAVALGGFLFRMGGQIARGIRKD